MQRSWIAVTFLVLTAVFGCNSGSQPEHQGILLPGTGPSGSTGGSTGSQPPPPPPVGPRLLTADLIDVDGSLTVSSGDEIELTFEADNDLLPGAQPGSIVRLLVAGDSLGQGATVLPGTNRQKKKIRLGQDPVLRVSGDYDPQDVLAGAASGLEILANAPVVGTNGGHVQAAGAVDLGGPFTAGFVTAGHLTYARGLHSATLLNDGRVLIVGGVSDGANQQYVANSEVYDPQSATFVPVDQISGQAGFMEGSNGISAVVRFGHSATLLADGRVLIAGGYGVERKERHWIFWWREVHEDLKSGHIFDPSTNSFHRVANDMSTGRSFHTATLLADGRVLVAGGHNGSLYRTGWWIFSRTSAGTVVNAEIFDPATERFSPLGGTVRRNMIEDRMGHTAFAVNNGAAVYFIGGARVYQGSQPQMTNTSEIYLGTPTFASRATLNQARWYHSATGLPNGRTLIAGGHVVSQGSSGQTLTSLEIYDPVTDTFSQAGDLRVPRARHSAAALGESGDVVFIGGISGYAGNSSIEADIAEIYMVSSGRVADAGQLTYPRNSHTCTTLADGRIIVIGGFVGGSAITSIDGMAISQAEIFSME